MKSNYNIPTDSPLDLALRRLKQNRAALFSLFFLIGLVLFLFLGPFFLQDPLQQSLENQLQKPSSKHILGTDELGRDLLARIADGGLLSLMVGIFATMISVFIGTCYGTIAGYFGGKTDQIAMRIVDIMYSLPYMFLVITLIAIFDRNIIVLFAALGAVQWLTTARIVRGQVLTIKQMDYITAARALGISNFWIISRHILPNIFGIVIIYATLTVPAVILQEAFLSFLGLNVRECTWGVLASDGASNLRAWWLILFPGLAITSTLLAFNFLGDGLRDALDPKELK
jgi:oligopeptide transport system permease protein